MEAPAPEGTYDPRGRGGARAELGREWTEEEISARLEYFLEIPRERWASLQCGRYVRYRLRSGEFRAGGFVANPSVEREDPEDLRVKRSLQLKPNFSAARSWWVPHEDIAALYVKMDTATAAVHADVQEGFAVAAANFERLAARVRALERRARRGDRRIRALERGRR